MGSHFFKQDNFTAANASGEHLGLIYMWVFENDHGNEETRLVGTHQYSSGENVAFLKLTTVHEMMNRSTVESKKKP